MNVLSLFTGAGGLDLGLKQAGWTIAAMCENDGAARKVLAHHWPNTPIHDDVRTLNGAEYANRVDVVAGGSPCQDLSVGGRRAGLVGERSRLFWDYCRVADACNARWVVWENVAGVLSSNNGEDFAAVLWGLTGLRVEVPEDGWRTAGMCTGNHRTAVWRVLDAKYFGVPQRRRRVFIVAGARNRCGPRILDLGDRGTVPVAGVETSPVESSARNAGCDRQVGTLLTGGSPAWPDMSDHGQIILDRFGPRSLTVVERERLMGWPDDWTVAAGSTRARWRLTGNGVVAPVACWIANQINHTERKTT